MLNKQFVNARIIEHENYVLLEITYCWYYIMNYTEQFVCNTVEQAKTKLLRERSHEMISVIGKDGRERNQEII